MTDVLAFGDSRSAALRHEVLLSMPDPGAHVEADRRRCVVVGSLDVPRFRDLGFLEVLSFEELGLDGVLAEARRSPRGCASASCGPAGGSGWATRRLRATSRSSSPTSCARTASGSPPTARSSTGAGARRPLRRSRASAVRCAPRSSPWRRSAGACAKAGS